MSTEKRKQTRYDSLNLAYLCEDEQGTVIQEGMGRTLNVSEGGILLETNFALEIGNSITLTIAMEDELVNVRGTVVHSKAGQGELFTNGVEFSDIPAEGKNVLHRFIALFTEQQRTAS